MLLTQKYPSTGNIGIIYHYHKRFFELKKIELSLKIIHLLEDRLHKD
jgi:hypothetical protein